MKEKLKALEVNLRTLLKKVETLEITQPDYAIMAKLGQIELKIDELFDLIRDVEGLLEDYD
ncbi:MAG: hypothetical protein PVF17_04650 [Ignavibacteria bacterium]|jgi:hypothetical protein